MASSRSGRSRPPLARSSTWAGAATGMGPALANTLVAKPPRPVPAGLVRARRGRGRGDGSQARGASNARAKAEIGCALRYRKLAAAPRLSAR